MEIWESAGRRFELISMYDVQDDAWVWELRDISSPARTRFPGRSCAA